MKSYRRKQQQRKMNMTIALTVIAALLLILAFSKLMTTTVTGSLDIEKEYYSILIDNDDTLWEIAQDYVNLEYQSVNDFVQTIININELSSETIYSGEYLIVPVIEINK